MALMWCRWQRRQCHSGFQMENNRDGDVETWSYYRTSLEVVSQSVYIRVCSMFQMKIFSSTSENRICVWSLLSQLVFARIHASLLKSPESSQCLHQKGNQVLSLLLKGWLDPPGTWILIGALILLGVPSCQSQASRRQSAINSINGRTCCHVNQPLEFLMWHVPCLKLFHASCFLLTIVNNYFNPIWFHPAMSVNRQKPATPSS